MGPLNGLFLRFANTSPEGNPGEGGGTAPNAEFPSAMLRPRFVLGFPPLRTRRIFDGNDDDVGVAGSTLTLLCGDLVCLCPETETEGDPMDIEDVEDAFECEWWW
jgi:hypothetical protein